MDDLMTALDRVNQHFGKRSIFLKHLDPNDLRHTDRKRHVNPAHERVGRAAPRSC